MSDKTLENKHFPDTCVIWPWRRDRHGYGSLNSGNLRGAHRVVYTLFVGPIPKGMCVMHSCDTPACVNPAHLRLGTNAENMRDKVSRNRQPRGVKHSFAKLTAAQVTAIRSGLAREEAMTAFGISKSTYYDVRSGETYRDVTLTPTQ